MLGLGNILTKGGAVLGFPNKYSFNFDGSNDYLETADNESFDFGTGDFSISFWFNVNDIDWNWAVSRANSANSADLYRAGTNNSGKIIFRDIAGGTDIVGSTTVSINTWYHFQAVRNSGTLKLYLNGSEDASGSSGGNFNSDKGFRVGRWQGSGDYFDGLIDEVAVWDTALSADDVAKIASKPVDFSKASTYATDRTSNLKLWLRAGDKAEPESTTAIARQDFYTDFDGTDDVINCGSDSSLDNIWNGGATITAWIKPESIGETEGRIIDKRTSGTGWTLHFKGNTGTACKLKMFHNYDGDDGAYETNDAVITYNEWQHLAMSYDTSGAGSSYRPNIYVNGILVAFGTVTDSTGTFDSDEANDLIIGNTGDGTRSYDGAISNLALHQTILDAQTISQMAKSRFTPMRDNRFSVVDFDGSNDYISLGNADIYPDDIDAEEFTIAGWFNGTGGTIISKADTSNRAIHLYISGGVILKAGGTTINSGFTPTSGEWNHFSIVSFNDSGTYKCNIYINGDFKAVGTTGTTTATDRDLLVGARRASSNTDATSVFTGSISSISLYNTAKSAEEIYAIYQQGITYDESSLSGLQGYWRMGDDTSKAYPTIADSSSNSNDGTITNGASDDIVQQMVAGYDLGAFESSSEELGGELVTNGTFDSNIDNWSEFSSGRGTASWSNGRLRVDETTGVGNYYSSQAQNFYAGKVYKLSVDVFAIQGTETALKFIFGTAQVHTLNASEYKSGDTYTAYLIPTADVTSFLIGGNGLADINELDNVSVKEVLQSADLSDTYPAIIDVNEPVLGVELITNGDFELDSNWADNNTPTVNERSTEQANGGTYSRKFTADAINDGIKGDTFSVTAGKTYKVSVDVYPDDNTQIRWLVREGDNSAWDTDNSYTSLTQDAWNTLEKTYVATSSGSGAYIAILSTLTSGTYYIDNVTIKEIQGNVGTMTNQDSADLVYSSVLPDQSFLTGVNSAYNFIDLDTTDEYIDTGDSIGDSLGNNYTGTLTVAMWIKYDPSVITGSGNGGIFYMGLFNGTYGEVNIYATSSNRIVFHINQWGSKYRLNLTDTSTDWKHIAFVIDPNVAGNNKVYLNGVDQELTSGDSPTFPLDLNFVSMNTIIGAYYNTSYTFGGSIGQTALWTKSLTDAEILAIYNLGRHDNLLDSYSDNLKGYWAMGALDAKTGLSDVGDGTIYDRSGNSNHGTATNTESADLKSSPNAEPNGYAKGDTNRSTTTP